MSQCTEQQFLSDVGNHGMEILRDDGINRHLKFTDNGSQIYRFDLITWPGHLCISGDCGTYVFSRIRDMFQFFRKSPESHQVKNLGRQLPINPSYWGEKLLSISTFCGYQEYSKTAFREAVARDFWHGTTDMPRPRRRALWREIKDRVVREADDGEVRAFDAAMSFHDPDTGFNFQDFWEHNCREYTPQYLWCLYAIVWGIEQYDLHHAEARVA